MIFSLFDYLINQPSAITSPLYTAVNTPAMLLAQGGAIGKIPVFDTRPDNQADFRPPYVRLNYIGDFTNLQGGINTGVQYQSNIQAAIIECVATATSPFEASARAEKLRLATAAAIANAKSYVMSGALSLADPGGTGSTVKITNFQIRPMAEPPAPSGPGTLPGSKQYTKIARLRLEVYVDYSLTH